MGAGLVQRALLEPVDDDAKTILIAMALTALDAPQNGHMPGIYWGGHDYLITIIRPDVQPGTPEWDAAAQSVKRRVRKLVQAGSLELLRRAARGRQAEYRLRFQVPSWHPTIVRSTDPGPVNSPVDNADPPKNGYHHTTPKRVTR